MQRVSSKAACTLYNWKVGEPKKFIHNHHRRLSPVPFVIEDRGYESSCWIWQRSVDKKGYGHTARTRAHIHFYVQKYGPVPKGKHLDHLCRQRSCCNPDHVEPVTNALNVQRGRTASVSPQIVASIRARLASGEKQISIARSLGVTATCVNFIAKNRTWRNL